MAGYTIRRILWVIPVLWAVATITFFLMHLVPGGPFTQDKSLPPAVNAALNKRYHLDKPIYEQYGLYRWDASHGDLGLSFQGDRDVSTLLRDGFFVTAQLGLMGFILAAVVGMVLGTLSALNQNGPLDYLGVVFATIGASVPNFIMAAFLGIPGVGRAFVTAVERRDYAMIMGSTLFYAVIITFANLIVDLADAVVDPRIRYR